MIRVIVLDKLSPDGLSLLEEAEDLEFEVRTGLAGEELRQALTEFDGTICRSGVKLTREVLEGNRRLRAIVRAGVGTDNIDKEAATRQGIVVMNTPAGNTLSTAELTVAMMLAVSRHIAPAYQSLREGRWDRSQYMGTQLAGKTLGIVGLGRIGQAVAARAKALEMRVLGFDPFLTPERTRELGIGPAENVEALLPEVDYLTVHVPLNDATRGMISAPQIARLKQGVRLINCARGGIYDEAALVEGLESGQIAGVALDVYEQEPCKESPLFGMPGVVATPHLGASTHEAQASVAVEGVDLLLDYLRRGQIRHAVNVSPLDAKTREELRGFLELAYRLGLMAAQLRNVPPRTCTLQYRGAVAEKDVALLSSSFAAGLLRQSLDEEVNIVNASFLLRERGIEVVERRSGESSAFQSTMAAELGCGEDSCRVVGTLFGNSMPRLVQVGPYRLETYLDGVLMIFTHEDVPGIIGSVGTIFGSNGVNIAQMAVGRERNEPGGPAIGVLNLDNVPPQAAIDEVLAQPGIHTAQIIRLPPPGEMPSWL